MNIIHQQQPTSNTCESTCIAMLLNVPVEKVIKEFHDDYFNNEIDTWEYLEKNGLEAEILRGNSGLDTGHIYLCAVPCLNVKGKFHAVVCDWRENIWAVYDPNEGKKDKFYYVPNYPGIPLKEKQFYMDNVMPTLKIIFK